MRFQGFHSSLKKVEKKQKKARKITGFAKSLDPQLEYCQKNWLQLFTVNWYRYFRNN